MPVRSISWPRIQLLQILLVALLVGTGMTYSMISGHGNMVAYHYEITVQSDPPYTFPDGGRQIFPHYRMVALYGTPGAPVLGSLGQQNLGQSIKRVKKLARTYQKYSKQRILPTFEIISFVASGTPTANNDYSRQVPPAKIQKWVTAASKNGIYVVLDLQSGRANSLSQAKQLKKLLLQPNVGLALDPEWRIRGNQRLLVDIGELSASEINSTAAWLSKLTIKNHLPQKLFLLHQFRIDMLPDRAKVDTSYPGLAYAIQMDGQGSQAQKDSTWQTITRNPPKHIHFGWKNFYVMDNTLLSPKATMSKSPKPWYISYQ